MTDDTKSDDSNLPEARGKRSRWFGVIWAVPLAAVIIVAYLGVQSLAQRGIEIIVTFNDANGVSVGDTKLVYQGVVVGEVTKIQINADGHRVDLTLRVHRSAERGLYSNTKFWLIGEKPTLSDISSVKAALLGVSIGAAPGVGGEPSRRFIGLERPPAIYPGSKGTSYRLTANRLRGIKIDSPIFYHGEEIGKVTDVNLDDRSVFRIAIFVLAPFDKLVDTNSLFWIASPLSVDVSGGSLNARFEHAGSLLTGGIEMDSPDRNASSLQSPGNSIYTLYSDEDGARAGPTGPHIDYAFRFNGMAGDLSRGAPVRLRGFRIGEVQSVQLYVDARTGDAQTNVLADLFPSRLGLPATGAPGSPAERAATDEMMRHLIARGYRARLVQKPLLIGGLVINLDIAKSAPSATLVAGTPPLIPSTDSGSSIDDVTDHLSQILAKVDNVPIEAIGQNMKSVTHNLDTLIASPQLGDSLHHLDSTLAQVDQVMTEVRPQIGPLVKKLNQVADEVSGIAAAAQAVLNGQGGNLDASVPAAIEQLTEAARSVRGLADYLDRHPEALLRGKGKDNQ